mmetsp:Transcript_37768/g.87734  ORF Transcript_37768/g.87734 Transcript_37768/m.87734 type:complete len:230 (-) Transcript_37768:355-1044(-)
MAQNKHPRWLLNQKPGTIQDVESSQLVAVGSACSTWRCSRRSMRSKRHSAGWRCSIIQTRGATLTRSSGCRRPTRRACANADCARLNGPRPRVDHRRRPGASRQRRRVALGKQEAGRLPAEAAGLAGKLLQNRAHDGHPAQPQRTVAERAERRHVESRREGGGVRSTSLRLGTGSMASTAAADMARSRSVSGGDLLQPMHRRPRFKQLLKSGRTSRMTVCTRPCPMRLL